MFVVMMDDLISVKFFMTMTMLWLYIAMIVAYSNNFYFTGLCIQLTGATDSAASTVVSIFLESCIWSISETDVQTVEQAILVFNSSVEIVSIFSVEITVILKEVLAISCPGQPMCSGHGSCMNARCLCSAGYHFCLVHILLEWNTGA